MTDPELIGLGYAVVKLITTVRSEQLERRRTKWRTRMEAALTKANKRLLALGDHFGLAFEEDSDRVIVLRRSAAAALEYQDETSKT